VRDEDLPELVGLAAAGIHDPSDMPFDTPWSSEPMPALGVSLMQHHWLKRAEMSPEKWKLELAVRWRGEMVGVQGAFATDYPVTRFAKTGSWLGQRHHGKGIGTAMRQAVCAFLFDELGAVELGSGAWADNPASQAVSRKLGYRDNGMTRGKRRDGEVETMREFLLYKEDFVRPADPLTVSGAAELRDFLGIA
jgi:RimJ/RimL family protein N-acetyltransferase